MCEGDCQILVATTDEDGKEVAEFEVCRDCQGRGVNTLIGYPVDFLDGMGVDEAMDTVRILRDAAERHWTPDAWLALPAPFTGALKWMEPMFRDQDEREASKK